MSCKSPQPFSPSILPSSTESAPFPFTPLIQKVSLIESDFARISLSPSLPPSFSPSLFLPLWPHPSIHPPSSPSCSECNLSLSLSLSLSLAAMPVWVQPGAISFSRLEIQINVCFLQEPLPFCLTCTSNTVSLFLISALVRPKSG